MSLFLGPIHHWVYNKVLFQDDITNVLIELGKEHGLDLETALFYEYGGLERKPLEEIIDDKNIHGWLQSRVTLVEKRYAKAVELLLDKIDITSLEKVLFDLGKNQQPNEKVTVLDIYTYLNDILLDGMPCDRVNQILSQGDQEIVWKRSQCVHTQYWQNSNINNYYLLRDALIKGMIEGSKFNYESTHDGTYRLSLEG